MINILAARIWDVLFLEFHSMLLHLGFRAFSGMFLVNGDSCPAETDLLEGSEFLHNQLQYKTALRDKLCIILYI